MQPASLPASTSDYDNLSRIEYADKMQLGYLLILINTAISFAYIFLAVYLEFTVALVSCVSLTLCQLFVLIGIKRRMLPNRFVSNLIALLQVIFIFPICYYSGGASSPVNVWLMVSITSIFLIGTSQQRVFWTCTIVATQVLNLVLFFSGHEFPNVLLPEHRDVFNALVASGAVLYVATVHGLYDKWKASILRKLSTVETDNLGLLRLRQQYEDVQSMVKAGAWELDVATGNTFWSSQIYDIYQIPPGTPTTKIDGISFYAPHERVRLTQLISDCVSRGTAFSGEFEFFDSTGNRKWVQSIGRPVLDSDGTVVKIVGTFQDVTEQVMKEKELELVLTNISEGYFDWLIPLDYEYMSPRFWEILGYDPKLKQHHPSEWQKLVHPDDLPRALGEFQHHVVSRGEHAFNLNLRYLHSRGEYVWIKCDGRVVEWSESGEPLRMVGTHRDIDEEVRRTNEALIIKSGIESYAIVSRTDAAGVITYANTQFCQISQYSPEELLGKTHRILNSGHHPAAFFEDLWDTITSGRPWRGEIKNRAKDGSSYWVDATIFPVLSPTGEREGYISFRYDITARKLAEAQLAESNQYVELALEGANLGIWDWNLVDNSIRYDRRWAEMLGLDARELRPELATWQERVHPDDVEKCLTEIYAYRAGKTAYYENIHRMKHANGHWVYILTRGRISKRDANGTPLNFTGTHFDMTEFMSAKLKVDLFFKRSPFGIGLCDLDGNFLETNEALRAITGHSPTELLHLSSRDLTPASYQQEDELQLARLRETGAYGPYRKEFRRKNGDLVPVKLHGFLVEDHQGQQGIWMIIEDISAKVRLESEKNELLERYQQVNKKLEAIFQFSPVAVYECQINESWTMNYISPYIEKITGHRDEDIIGDARVSFSDLIHPEDQAVVAKTVFDAIAQGESYNITYRMLHQNGEVRWIWDRGSKVPGNDLLIGVLFDITDKKQAEEDSRRVAAELNKFFDLSLNFLLITSPTGQFQKFNDAWLRLGYTPQELTGRGIAEFCHPDERALVVEHLLSLSYGRAVTRFELRFRKKDDTYLRLDWSGIPDEDTGLLYFAATDVTERNRREEITLLISHVRSRFIELAGDREKFFSYLLEKILAITGSEYGFIGEILEDSRGKFLKTFVLTDISWNQATRELYEKNAAKGLEFRNLRTLFGEVIKTGEVLIANDAPVHPRAGGIPEGHPPLRRFMGIPISYNGKVFAMVGVANNPIGYRSEDLVFLRPFFDLVGEMIQSIKLSSELEFQRRISLHNAKLASIGELAAGVGHEINNPLAIILGQLEMLKAQLVGTSAYTEVIEPRLVKSFKSIDRIANITKGLRAFARADAEEHHSVNISGLLAETRDMLSEIFLKDNVVLIFDVPPEIWVKGNRGRLQQVFVNLLNNAHDALAAAATKEIRVHAALEGTDVVIRISDTGAGVPESIRQKIFDPFFTTKAVNKGTGIGLALVSSIIKEHGGLITVTNSESGGACFELTLRGGDLPAREVASEALAPVAPRNATGRVLIVEDEEDLREVLHALFAKQGMSVVTATDGDEALAYVTAHGAELDLVISDMRMPRMSGPELARAVRGSGIYCGPILFLTGGVNIALDDYRGLVDGVISKPINEEKIRGIIHDWIRPRKA